MPKWTVVDVEASMDDSVLTFNNEPLIDFLDRLGTSFALDTSDCSCGVIEDKVNGGDLFDYALKQAP